MAPLSVKYRGFWGLGIPPNGQGLVALMALNILRGFEFSTRDCVVTLHGQIEAMKLAFADGRKHITDTRHMDKHLSEPLLFGRL